MQRRFPTLILLIASLMIFAGSSHARYEVEVLDTYPSGDNINMGLGDRYSVQIRYKTDEPIRIWARPFFNGSQVPMMTNASELHTGEGEVLGWFSSNDPVEVDEVRILVGERGGHGKEATGFPVKIHIGAGASPLEAKPAWITTLINQSELSRKEAMEQYSDETYSGNAVFAFGFIAIFASLFFGGFVLPVVAFFVWKGRWRIAAAVPIVLMGLVMLRIIIDTAIDPTSHNLWPFEIIMFSVISVVFIIVAQIVKFATRERVSQ